MRKKLPAPPPEPIINNPECQITDKLFVHHKDANLIREIIYSNPGLSDIPIGIKEISYPYFCEDFSCRVNDKEITPEILEKNYAKIIRFNLEDKVKPKEHFKIVVQCIWRDFISLLDNFEFLFTYSDKAKYTLIIEDFSLKDKLHIIFKNEILAIEKGDYFIGENNIHFNPIPISLQNYIKIKILTLSTPKELRTLSYFNYPPDQVKKFSDYIIIFIQHLLSDFVHLVNSFEKNGAEKKHIFIIGIPYSTKEKTRRYLNEMGYPNIETPKNYPFEETVKAVMEKAISLANNISKKILIVEDGGYAVPILHKYFLNDKDKFIGAVEQTTNGIWRDQEIKNKDGIDYCIPIINVAESQIKSKLESPLIGRAVCRNIELLVGKEYHDLSGKKIALIGCGRTGTEIAENLKNRGCIVNIYDEDSIQRMVAKYKGYRVGNDAREIIRDSDIIVESTGKEWCCEDEILEFKHYGYFLNASSKRLGINYEKFNRLVKSDSKVNLPGIGVRYTLQNNRIVTLLADGYPINFFIGESVPDEDISFILALLFKSAEFIVDKNKNGQILSNKIIDFEENDELKKLESKIAEIQNQLNK